MSEKRFTELEEIFIPTWNLVEGRVFEKALEKVENIAKLIESGYKGPEHISDCWGLYHYLKGCCLKGLNNFEEARKEFEVGLIK